jgi:hypothetical protein
VPRVTLSHSAFLVVVEYNAMVGSGHAQVYSTTERRVAAAADQVRAKELLKPFRVAAAQRGALKYIRHFVRGDVAAPAPLPAT